MISRKSQVLLTSLSIEGTTMEKRTIAVFDAETDPFNNGAPVYPFTCGLLTEHGEYVDFWDSPDEPEGECFRKMAEYLARLKTPLKIYAHNGGKFDWVYLIRYELIDPGEIKLIGSRMVKAEWNGHQLRDSYSILPVPLHQLGGKDDKYKATDYAEFTRENREAHKEDIRAYQKLDCEVCLNAVLDFREKHGDALTIGSAAVKELRRLNHFEKHGPEYDEVIRPYYYGGRVEAIRPGEHPVRPFHYFDVNSMYPFVMAEREHFCGGDPEQGTAPEILRGEQAQAALQPDGQLIEDGEAWPYFITFTGYSRGALPVRDNTPAGLLSFPHTRGTFQASHHELIEGLALGLIEVDSVDTLIAAQAKWSAPDFVAHYGEIKQAYKPRYKNGKLVSGHIGHYTNAKLLLNSSYGKTGQCPTRFRDHKLVPIEEVAHFQQYGWQCYLEGDEYVILWKPAEEGAVRSGYFDVGIGASITGASRAVLLRALALCESPIYCDTDSIVCEYLPPELCHPSRLGAWDIEFSATQHPALIAGKKMYAFIDDDGQHHVSSKGVTFNRDQIAAMVNGEIVENIQAAPMFFGP
jgi:hypothetical protein